MTPRKYAAGLLVALTLPFSTPAGTHSQPVLEAEAVVQPLNPNRGVDRYLFEAAPYTRLTFTTRIVYHPSFKSLSAAYGDPKTEGKLMAFTKVANDAGECEVHLIDPKVVYYPQYVGHELLHCVHGNFHPNQ